jgi:hypothetical protein
VDQVGKTPAVFEKILGIAVVEFLERESQLGVEIEEIAPMGDSERSGAPQNQRMSGPGVSRARTSRIAEFVAAEMAGLGLSQINGSESTAAGSSWHP